MKPMTKEQSNAFLVAVAAAMFAHRLGSEEGSMVLLIREMCNHVFQDIGLTADETVECFDIPSVTALRYALAGMIDQSLFEITHENEHVRAAEDFFRRFKAAGGKVN